MATKVVGGIAADLVLRTAAWHNGFTRAGRDVKTFQSAVTRSLATFAGYAAAALSVRKLASVFNETRQAIDKLAKTSDRLGLSTETLAGFNFAAKIAGASTESVATALTFMAKTIGEASEKGGEYEEVLQRIGLTSSQLMALNPEQQYRRIAQGISQMGTAAEKTAATMRIFGRGGNDIAALIAGGDKALDSSIAKAKEYGTAISRDAAAQVERMNDALTTAGEIWDGIKTQVLIGVAPAIADIAKEVAGLISTLRGTTGGALISSGDKGIDEVRRMAADLMRYQQQVVAEREQFGSEEQYQAALDYIKTEKDWLQVELAISEAQRNRREARQEQLDRDKRAFALFDKESAALQLVEDPTAKLRAEAEKRIAALTEVAGKDVMLQNEAAAIIVQIRSQLAEDIKAIDDKSYDARLAQMRQESREREAQNEKRLREAEELARAELAFRNEVVQGSLGLMSALAAGEDQQTRKGFERAKKYAIAQVTIDTAAAIMNIWSAHAKNPIRAGVMTALAVATGAAQIANIRKTSFDGGGGVSAPSLGMAGGESVGGGPRMINLTLSGGGRYSTEEVIGLMEQFGEQMADGYKLAVSGG